MKALVKKDKGYDNMELIEMEEPTPEGNLVKVKVEYSGICGTDLHAFQGKYGATAVPVVLGHEFSGVISEIGPNVKNLKIGDRVTSETTFATCGKCEYCLTKDYNLCSERKGIGTQINGSFAEYVLTREESVHLLTDNVSLLSAALSEPLACCVHACLEKTVIEEGETILVFGPGAIGLLLSQVAKSRGAYVILAGVSKDKKRFEIGVEIGVDKIIDQQQCNINEVIAQITNGKGVDKVFECSGAIMALNKGFELVKKKGEVIQLGVFANDINEVNTSLFFPKEIKYIGTRSQKPSSWIKSMELLYEEKVEPEKIVTMVTDLENWREGFEKSMNCDEVKVVLKCSK